LPNENRDFPSRAQDVLTKEAHRFNAAATDFTGNDAYDALPSSAHPMFIDNESTREKTVFVRPL